MQGSSAVLLSMASTRLPLIMVVQPMTREASNFSCRYRSPFEPKRAVEVCPATLDVYVAVLNDQALLRDGNGE